MAQGSRTALRAFSDDVEQQLSVITCTRKKHAKMAALEVASRLQKARDLHMHLK